MLKDINEKTFTFDNLIIPFSQVSYISILFCEEGVLLTPMAQPSKSTTEDEKNVSYHWFALFMRNGNKIDVCPVNLNSKYIRVKSNTEFRDFEEQVKKLHDTLKNSF